jgi:predicted ATPase/DNA-binding CsgD family transcriptional regulator
MPDVSTTPASWGRPASGTLGGALGTLPRPLTSFIGRERELAEARQLLKTSNLLTLTGPGGSGKTRLCIELASQVADEYPDGVYFIPLAPVRDPALVASSIAQHIGLHDSQDRPLLDHLAGYLSDRQLLIVLDNFEHVLAAASVVAELLRRTTAVRFVVSSRSSLRLSGEQQCPVPPLALPDQPVATPRTLAACESVRLFTERAAAGLPGFVVDDLNAAAIAQIVRRLDGLPLAIELAAARVRLLPPEAILDRLEHSLGLLVGGSRDLPDRQQTLRSTIGWSYDLLSEGARILLAACSVFRGGLTLEFIESVCAGSVSLSIPVLDGLQELVDHSLLRQVRTSGTPRYAMLETIREFAAERLAELPEADRVYSAHAAVFLSLTSRAGRPLTLRPELIEQLDFEHNNVRAAIDWCLQADPTTALHLAAGMSSFWSLRGYFTEGRERLRKLLDVVPAGSDVRISALLGAGWLALDQGDHVEAARRLEECIELSRSRDDPVGEGIAYLGLCRSMVTTQRAADGMPSVQRAEELLTKAGDQPGIALSLLYSGLVAMFTGRLEAACDLFTRCAALCKDLGFVSLGARAMQLLGIARLDLDDLDAAAAALREGLPITVGMGDRFVIPIGLSGFAGLAAKRGRPQLALRLAGAATAYSETNEFSLPDALKANVDRWLAPCRRAVGAAAARLLAQGRDMPLAAAVACALGDEPGRPAEPGPGSTLTRREREVAVLVADGRTNRDIASRLSLSVRTVEVHVDHILTKLGFHTRTELAAWVHEEGQLVRDT